jgi:hypothetical protein
MDIGDVLLQRSGNDTLNNSYSLSDPTTLKTPTGDYETQNFSREDFI